MAQGSKKERVTIEKLVEGGWGLARVGGEVLFVRGSLPGEEVVLTGGLKRKGVREADIHEIVRPSPSRVVPSCPVYGACGGCQLQHMRYEEQLAQKVAVLRETLQRVGNIHELPILPVMPSPNPFGYRSTIRFVVVQGQGTLELGFRRHGSHRPVGAADCLLPIRGIRDIVNAIQERLATIRTLPAGLEAVEVRGAQTTGDTILTHRFHRGSASPTGLGTNKEDASQVAALFDRFESITRTNQAAGIHGGTGQLVGQVGVMGKGRHERRWVRGQDWIMEQLGGIRYRISARSFMQANWLVAEQLSNLLIDWVKPEVPRKVLELFAGIGTLGLPLARAGALVTMVEGNPHALADARFAAKANHIGGCRFRHQSVEAFLETAPTGTYDLVVVDPPRTGLSRQCLKLLPRLGCRTIQYISCDAPTLARDLAMLQKAGYRLTRIQPLDMFAQTARLETLVELVAS